MQSTLIMNGRKLVPLSQYKKPLLRLDKRESGAIWSLSKRNYVMNKKISDLELELGLPGQTKTKIVELKQKIKALVDAIKENNTTIREIKISAYQEQLKNTNLSELA